MVDDGFEGVLGWVWDVFGWLLAGLGMVLGCCCAWVWGVSGLFFDCFWGSRSQVAEKVEEPEPMRARERTTGRAVWGGLAVFWLACWIAVVGLV